MVKPKRRQSPYPNRKAGSICECREFEFRKNQLVCKNCGKPMKSEKKPISNKGMRFTSGFFDK